MNYAVRVLTAVRRSVRAFVAAWLADLGAFLRSLDDKPKLKRRR